MTDRLGTSQWSRLAGWSAVVTLLAGAVAACGSIQSSAPTPAALVNSATPSPTVSSTPTATATGGPHFVMASDYTKPSSAAEAATFDPNKVRIGFSEAGLRPGQQVAYRASADVALGYGCTDGTHPPTGGSQVSGALSSEAILTASDTGEAVGALTLDVRQTPGIACPAGQQAAPYSVKLDNVLISDVTDGVSQDLPSYGSIA